MYKLVHSDGRWYLFCTSCEHMAEIPATRYEGSGITVAELRHLCPQTPR